VNKRDRGTPAVAWLSPRISFSIVACLCEGIVSGFGGGGLLSNFHFTSFNCQRGEAGKLSNTVGGGGFPPSVTFHD